MAATLTQLVQETAAQMRAAGYDETEPAELERTLAQLQTARISDQNALAGRLCRILLHHQDIQQQTT